MGGVLALEPSDFVDLLLDFQTLQIVELGLMTLKGAVDVVLASFGRRHFRLSKTNTLSWLNRHLTRSFNSSPYPGIPLKDDHPSAFIARSQQITILIELHARYDIRYTTKSKPSFTPILCPTNHPRSHLRLHRHPKFLSPGKSTIAPHWSWTNSNLWTNDESQSVNRPIRISLSLSQVFGEGQSFIPSPKNDVLPAMMDEFGRVGPRHAQPRILSRMDPIFSDFKGRPSVDQKETTCSETRTRKLEGSMAKPAEGGRAHRRRFDRSNGRPINRSRAVRGWCSREREGEQGRPQEIEKNETRRTRADQPTAKKEPHRLANQMAWNGALRQVVWVRGMLIGLGFIFVELLMKKLYEFVKRTL